LDRASFAGRSVEGHRVLDTWPSTQKGFFIPFGRLHFAGTESADAWRGYIEGAMQSGERDAQSILQALRCAGQGLRSSAIFLMGRSRGIC